MLPNVTQNHSWLDKIHIILVSFTILRREGNGEAGLVCKGLWCFNGIKFFCYALVLFYALTFECFNVKGPFLSFCAFRL